MRDQQRMPSNTQEPTCRVHDGKPVITHKAPRNAGVSDKKGPRVLYLIRRPPKGDPIVHSATKRRASSQDARPSQARAFVSERKSDSDLLKDVQVARSSLAGRPMNAQRCESAGSAQVRYRRCASSTHVTCRA